MGLKRQSLWLFSQACQISCISDERDPSELETNPTAIHPHSSCYLEITLINPLRHTLDIPCRVEPLRLPSERLGVSNNYIRDSATVPAITSTPPSANLH